MLAAPLSSRWPPGASGPLWVQRALQGQAGVTGGGAGQEQSQQGRRKRHFSLGWCSWSRPWPQGSSGPAWLRPRRWVVTEDPGGGGRVGTWQHSQGREGPEAPHRLRTRLGHQDGLLPHLQDVCGERGEAGEMGLKPERDCDGEDGPLVREAHAGWSTGTFSSNPQTCRAAVP